jgi:hypothetical protein
LGLSGLVWAMVVYVVAAIGEGGKEWEHRGTRRQPFGFWHVINFGEQYGDLGEKFSGRYARVE